MSRSTEERATAGEEDPSGIDLPRVLARARAAHHRAEVLRDLTREAIIQAIIAQVRAESVAVSPTVEARLHLLLGRPDDSTAARAAARAGL
jgi:hypothetical protein